MASGVTVQDDCVDQFNKLKLGHNYSYVIFKISDDLKNIVVDKLGEKGASFDEFRAAVAGDGSGDPKYAVYDCCYKTKEGNREKVVFLVWCPDTAPIKKKMLIASSKDALKKKLVGVHAEVQASEISEINIDDMAQKCEKK